MQKKKDMKIEKYIRRVIIERWLGIYILYVYMYVDVLQFAIPVYDDDDCFYYYNTWSSTLDWGSMRLLANL